MHCVTFTFLVILPLQVLHILWKTVGKICELWRKISTLCDVVGSPVQKLKKSVRTP